METQVFEQWNGFHGEAWKKCIDVQDFIHQNVASYEGDDSFLMGATERTQRLMQKLNQLLSVEQNFAGTLIEQTGLKGLSVGDAQVSHKHAGFVINTGNAKAKDVLDLIKEVQKRVYDQHGVHLEPEVRMIGED